MNRKTIQTIIGTFVIIVIIAVAYHLIFFRHTGTRPTSNEHPSFVRYVEFSFSHNVESVDKLTLDNEDLPGEVKIDGKKIRYTHNDLFVIDTEHTLRLTGVKSTSGMKIDVTHSFTPTYIDFEDIPEDLREESIQKSSSGQIDDPFFNNYFPMQTSKFQIENPRSDPSETKGLYVTFMEEVFNYDTNTKQTLPNPEAEKLREEVYIYIRDRGGKPEQYSIHYDNEYLENKYNRHLD